MAITWAPLLLMTWLFNPQGFSTLLRDYRVYARLLIAMGIEIGWEITENSPAVIQHYRQQALAARRTRSWV